MSHLQVAHIQHVARHVGFMILAEAVIPDVVELEHPGTSD